MWFVSILPHSCLVVPTRSTLLMYCYEQHQAENNLLHEGWKHDTYPPTPLSFTIQNLESHTIGCGNLSRREKLHVDITASAPAQARMARALLVTHLQSREKLLRLEQRRRSMEGSLSAFEVREFAAGATKYMIPTVCTTDGDRGLKGTDPLSWG